MEKKKVWLEKKLKNNLKIMKDIKNYGVCIKFHLKDLKMYVIKLKNIMTELIKFLKRKFVFRKWIVKKKRI